MDPGVVSIALFFALVLFAAAAALPFIEVVGDRGASVALGVGFALLGALFVWLAVVAQ
jgi:hypothetical protein